MNIHESAENYFEAILVLGENDNVRSVDVAKYLGFSKPTVSVAMKNFRENGYIEINEKGYITLTKSGREIGERIYERHIVIADFLMSLGVSRETALKDSCKMEHDLSDESFNIIKKIVNNK